MLLEYLNNLPHCLISAVGTVLIAKNLLNEKSSKSIVYNILVICIYTFIIFCTNATSYIPLQTVVNCLALTFVIKYLFSVKVVSAFTASIIVFALLMASQLLLVDNPLLSERSLLIRTNITLYTIINLLLVIIGYTLSKISFINKPLKKFQSKFENDENKNDIIILIFLISVLTFFSYMIFLNRNIEVNKFILLVFILILVIMFCIHVYEKNKYSSLIAKYNNLLDYACTYEEEFEKDKLIRHEHKNQLAVIKGMTKEEDVLKYIDDLLKDNKKADNISLRGISNLPSGGLRGLIYYKLTIIKKKKINYSLDISRNVKNKLLNLKEEQKKKLSYIIGVFLDNAIEECETEKDANISIEIYLIGNEINIIITNTLHNKVDLQKIGEKGYTTKGKNHGNGIFLIKSLLKDNDVIKVNTKIINNYFVQEIKININEEDA